LLKKISSKSGLLIVSLIADLLASLMLPLASSDRLLLNLPPPDPGFYKVIPPKNSSPESFLRLTPVSTASSFEAPFRALTKESPLKEFKTCFSGSSPDFVLAISAMWPLIGDMERAALLEIDPLAWRCRCCEFVLGIAKNCLV
jgi:hypothetical protein